jgi:uncharacterized protein (TIGR02246 family)
LTTIVVAASVCLAASHASIGGAQTQGSSRDVDAIKQIVMQMTQGMNSGNAKMIAGVYAPDADLVTVFGQHLRGPAEIERVMGAFFQTSLKKIDAKTVNVDVRFIRPDVAFAHVTNDLSGALDTKGEAIPPVQELSLRVFVKDNDTWRVAAFHNTIVREAAHK